MRLRKNMKRAAAAALALSVALSAAAPAALAKDYYIGEGKHVAIKGMGTIEEIFGRIKDAVNNL